MKTFALLVACGALVLCWTRSYAQEAKLIRTFEKHGGAVRCVAFSPDGKTLATGSEDTTVKLWDVATGKELTTLKGHTDVVSSVAFAADGKTIAAGSWSGAVQLWSVPSWTQRAALRHGDNVTCVAFSPDGKMLATGGEDELVRLWDVVSAKEVAVLEGHQVAIRSLAFSPDGKTLASGAGKSLVGPQGELRLWDVAGRKEIRRFQPTEGDLYDVYCVAFSSGGRTLASASAPDNPKSKPSKVRLWDVATGRERTSCSLDRRVVYSLACSPDGRTLAAGGSFGIVTLLDAATGSELASFNHGCWVFALAFRPDGKAVAVGGTDATVALWDLAKVLKKLEVHVRSEGPPGRASEDGSGPRAP